MKLRTYAMNAGFAVVYAGVYMLCYIDFLNYHYDYFGFALFPRPAAFLLLSIFICTIPVFCYRGFRSISSVLAMFTYIILYTPIVLTFALGTNRSVEEVLLVQVTFMVCMCLLFLVDSVNIRNPFEVRTNVNLMPCVFFLTMASTLYLVFSFRGSLKLASFADAYVQRSATEAIESGVIVRYTSAWLYAVLIPICLAFGLAAKKYSYFVLGAAACLTLYMATAAKSAVVLPVVFVGVYALMAKGRSAWIYPAFTGALSLVICVLVGLRDAQGITFVLSSLVLMRTIGTGGLLTTLYYDFFSTHAQIGYSYINLVRMVFGGYPFGNLQVGQVIGQQYFALDMNANANFWATDGIAAMGLPGVLIVSLAAASVFLVFNAVTRSYDRVFVTLCFLPYVVTFLNLSFVSSLWSGGAFFLVLFFLFNRRGTLVGIADSPSRGAAATAVV